MNKLRIIVPVLCLGLGLITYTGHAQLYVSNAQTPYQWVQNHLVGTGVTVFNINYSGAQSAAGTFYGNTNLGVSAGVLLTSGDINIAIGPNNSTSAGVANNSATVDADLSSFIAPITVYDICKLEFDFVPQSDTIKFNYVFGSDEYPEYVGTGFNDCFGFFLSGPGIFGPYQNNGTNIALIPGTNTPVAINNVNQNLNTQYYIDNFGGQTIQYDGFTTVLTAIHHVIACDTFHIKLCIGDGQDHIFDSGVFLEENSFSSSAINVSTNFVSPSNPLLKIKTAIEGCRKAVVTFTLPFAKKDTSSIQLDSIRGTAINGLDYTFVPLNFMILPYHISANVVIDPIYDGIPGPNKTVILYFKRGVCDLSDTGITVPILDYTAISATVRQDTALCEGSVQLWVNPTYGMPPYNYFWTPVTTVSDPFAATPIASPTQTTMYYVEVRDSTNCSVARDSVLIGYSLNPLISFKPDPSNEGCDPLTVNFLNNTTPFIQTYLWDLGDGSTSNLANPTHTYHYDPGVTGYDISITATTPAGCTRSYSVSKLIKVYEQPKAGFDVLPPDSTYFPEQEITLTNTSVTLANNHYLWNFGDTANGTSTDVNKVISYFHQGEYTVWLYAWTDHGCKDSISRVLKIMDYTIEIPNIITPNGDGKNDKFVIKNILNYPSSQLVLFNRWGKKIYEAAPYKNDWGAASDSDGVYYYILKFKRGNNVVKYDGALTVMR